MIQVPADAPVLVAAAPTRPVIQVPADAPVLVDGGHHGQGGHGCGCDGCCGGNDVKINLDFAVNIDGEGSVEASAE